MRWLAAGFLLAFSVHFGTCGQPKSKEDRLAATEKHIQAKLEKLQERQQQIADKLSELQARLAEVRERRELYATRAAEPTRTRRPDQG